MKAIYVNWSQPFIRREKLRGHGFKIFKTVRGDEYYKPDYEILYTILSVNYWKKHNGTTKLYTDKIGAAYYEKLGILEMWDEVDTEKLEEFSKLNIDGGIFWTSAKSFCIATEPTPFVFSDLDFIVRQRMPEFFYSTDVSIPHWEIPRGYYYPNEKDLFSLENWKPFTGFSSRMLVPNTSLLYVNNTELQELYWQRHMQLIKDSKDAPEWVWLLADQGLFGQTIRNLNLKTSTLTDAVFLSENEGWMPGGEGWADMWFYKKDADRSKDSIEWEHVWLAKVAYTFNEQFKLDETERYKKEVSSLFPKYAKLI